MPASLLQAAGNGAILGLVVGRFQKASAMSRGLLLEMVDDMPQLRGLPVVANVDFGHTFPLITFPIGGDAAMEVGDAEASVTLTRH